VLVINCNCLIPVETLGLFGASNIHYLLCQSLVCANIVCCVFSCQRNPIRNRNNLSKIFLFETSDTTSAPLVLQQLTFGSTVDRLWHSSNTPLAKTLLQHPWYNSSSLLVTVARLWHSSNSLLVAQSVAFGITVVHFWSHSPAPLVKQYSAFGPILCASEFVRFSKHLTESQHYILS